MGLRDLIVDHRESVIAFGAVVGSSLSSRLKNLLLRVTGQDEREEFPEATVYGCPGVLWRPAAPEDDGTGMEVMFLRSGEEAIVFAAREPRFQLDLAEGEVAVRAFGDSAAVIRLKANGDIELGKGASLGAALDAKVEDRLATIRQMFTEWVPSPQDGGAALKSIATRLLPATYPESVGSSKVKVVE